MSSKANYTPDALKVQIINDENGQPSHVVITHRNWLLIKAQLEDMADSIVAEKSIEAHDAGNRVEFPQDVVDKLLTDGSSRLAVIRKWRNLTQAQLAELVGSDRVYIANIERGARSAGRKLQKALATALNVRKDVLFPDD